MKTAKGLKLMLLTDANIGMWQVQSKNSRKDYLISENCPGVKGFNRRGLYRMKQFFETYKDKNFVSTLLTQSSWSNHLAILYLLSSFKPLKSNER